MMNLKCSDLTVLKSSESIVVDKKKRLSIPPYPNDFLLDRNTAIMFADIAHLHHLTQLHIDFGAAQV
jgi:hypothetical protein